jgi:hypothetical protein
VQLPELIREQSSVGMQEASNVLVPCGASRTRSGLSPRLGCCYRRAAGPSLKAGAISVGQFEAVSEWRFKSQALVDEARVLTAMAYGDMNTPESLGVSFSLARP